MVKSVGDFLSKRKESGSAGVTRSKTVLVRRPRKSLEEVRVDEAFEDFERRAEKGDRAVRSGEVEGFTRFRDGDYKGLLPDTGNVTGVEGEVK